MAWGWSPTPSLVLCMKYGVGKYPHQSSSALFFYTCQIEDKGVFEGSGFKTLKSA